MDITINESLFQYIWKNSLFSPVELFSTEGEAVVVQFPGVQNQNAGPDFLEGKIKIGNTIWVGNIELHLRTSDWNKHQHAANTNYHNIILHVVYEDDEPLRGYAFPTLELKNHLDKTLMERYHQLMQLQYPIPCQYKINSVPEIVWEHWLDTLLAERWEQKLEEWTLLWQQEGNDWRTLLYYRLAANFGFHVNRDTFLTLALSIPLSVLIKHRKNLFQLEALLFGQSGLLQQSKQDAYMSELETEYHFLRRKYQLTPLFGHQWKFMRLRPANFPTIRIAQFAMLVHKSLELFAQMIEIKNARELSGLLDTIHASTYWNTHYRFGEITEEDTIKYLGKDAIQNILINTVAPMQHLYAKLQGKATLLENSIELLQGIAPEKNKIIQQWQSIAVKVKDAAQSQALLQLFQEYCLPKKCLQCSVGNRLIRKG